MIGDHSVEAAANRELTVLFNFVYDKCWRWWWCWGAEGEEIDGSPRVSAAQHFAPVSSCWLMLNKGADNSTGLRPQWQVSHFQEEMSSPPPPIPMHNNRCSILSIVAAQEPNPLRLVPLVFAPSKVAPPWERGAPFLWMAEQKAALRRR